MTAGERESGIRGVVTRFVGATIPLAIVCILLFGFAPDPSQNLIGFIFLYAISAVVLWLCWSFIRRSIGAKWFGILLASFLGLVLGLFAVGVVIRIAPILFLIFLVALPFVAYDLFFRGPFQGRFERARAERRHLRPSR